jgi:DNA polymerase-3 subunit gamma/tau
MLIQSERPIYLKDIVGQKKIIKEFKSRSKDLDYNPVMLFTGASGSGKTTSAQIVAATLNCQNPVDNGEYKDPCWKCESCQSILTETYSGDISFLDGSALDKAGVLGIEDIASLNPLFSNNRIIIIDEAQQLNSPASRGALLKLLEKKRKNVFFILLTMDDSKFDKAILDRCSSYKFKPVSYEDVSTHLFNLLEKLDPDEKIPNSFVTEGIPIIGNNCDGSVRKAVGDFERALRAELFTKEEILKELEYQDEDTTLQLFIKIVQGDINCIKQIKEVDHNHFFHYSWKVLLSVKEKILLHDELSSAQSIIKTQVDELLELYSEISRKSNNWVSENIYKMMIYNYISNRASTKTEEAPKRRRLAE